MRLFTAVALCAIALVAFCQPIHAQIVADSSADFPAADNVTSDSKQGIGGWTYGYHDLTANGAYNGANFIAFPDNAGPNTSPTDFWNGSGWDWHAGNPPWTFIGQEAGHPNTGGNDHWAIRRWTSDVTGAANIDYHLRATNLGGPDGTDVRVFVNGVQQGATLEIGAGDGTGKTFTTHLSNLNIGDTVDFALGFVATDGSDGSAYTGVVNRVSSTRTLLVADSIADFPAPGAESAPKQGTNSWQYGYHSVTSNGAYDATPGGTDDFIAFPDNQGAGTSATDFWTNSAWDWHNGNPPWTVISAAGGHPNGTNQSDEQWAIRRYIVEDGPLGGLLEVEAFLVAQDTTGGNGTILHVFHNGSEVGTLTVGGTDGIGLMDVFSLENVAVGDFIDFALDSNGADGNDGSFFSAQLFAHTPEPASVAIWALLGLGLAAWPVARRFRRKQ